MDNALLLEYVPCTGGARLVRAFGNSPCPALPETIDGLPLAELGPYCFAEAQRESALPGPAEVKRAVLPGADASCTHRIGGHFLEEITLPTALHTVGSCAFYNCRRLSCVSLGSCISSYGSDVFLNTFRLQSIILRAAPNAASSLFRLVNNIQTDLCVHFCPHGTVQAAAFYPEYWEDMEETPAHILLHSYSGQGYHYRQCFHETVPLWAEYDAVFPLARAEDPPAAMVQLALGRLRWPWQLSEDAAAQYRAYLAEHMPALLAILQRRQDSAGLSALLTLGILDDAALQAGVQAMAQGDWAEGAALLANAQHQTQSALPAGSRYDFNF